MGSDIEESSEHARTAMSPSAIDRTAQDTVKMPSSRIVPVPQKPEVHDRYVPKIEV